MALSSITKKLIMSISGLFLILFMLLHSTINFFSVIEPSRALGVHLQVKVGSQADAGSWQHR